MQINEIKILVDQYFDGELEKGKEPILFTALSINYEAREYFKNMNLLKSNIPFTLEELPQNLEKRILFSIAETKPRSFLIFPKSKLFYFASYALTVLLMILSLVLYIQTNNYKTNIESVNDKINKQTEVIQLLMNSLPVVEVNSVYENKAEVKANL